MPFIYDGQDDDGYTAIDPLPHGGTRALRVVKRTGPWFNDTGATLTVGMVCAHDTSKTTHNGSCILACVTADDPRYKGVVTEQILDQKWGFLVIEGDNVLTNMANAAVAGNKLQTGSAAAGRAAVAGAGSEAGIGSVRTAPAGAATQGYADLFRG